LLKYCPTEINLRLVIEENIDNFILQASNKEIVLKTDINNDKFIFADKNMINTVLRNLISNAIKFTHKNGSVTINTKFASDEIVMSVTDTGVGMSQVKIDQLFQLDNSLSMPGTEKEQGTGLGLRLCKDFTDIMGGRIWAESVPGKGSKFSFTIPFKAKGPGLRAQGKND
jgi:signal transduction histidine kinase